MELSTLRLSAELQPSMTCTIQISMQVISLYQVLMVIYELPVAVDSQTFIPDLDSKDRSIAH